MNARQAMLFATGLVATGASCLIIHATAPFPDISQLRPKLDYFKQHRDEFDAVFVGSSRIYHHISPQLFDRTVQERGHEIRSFNFGVHALSPPESFYIVDKILELKPRKLRWLFLELAPLPAEIEPKRMGTIRATYWHDWNRTRWVCRKARADAAESGARELLALHLGLFLKNYANIGRGPDFMSSIGRIFNREKRPAKSLGPAADGFTPSPDEAWPTDAREAYAQNLAWLKSKKLPADPTTDDAFRELALRVRAASAAPVFVIPPTALPLPPFFEGRGGGETVFAFNDPAAFPELYQVALRSDVEHLNAAGAGVFTQLLARRFCDYLSNPH